MKIHSFLHRWCLCCQEFKYMFWISVLCLWPDQFEFMALFVAFNMWIGPGFILSLVVNI